MVATRPTEVEISSADVTAVLRQLPEQLGQLPAGLRWRLGGLIRDKLRSGWLPEQILTILAAPMPDAVAAPFSLARWRLMQNMPGPGPGFNRCSRLSTGGKAPGPSSRRMR